MAKIVLRKDNPYALGSILRFSTTPPVLDRDVLVYQTSTEDKFHEMVEGETLDTLAYKYYKNSKYWWVIADANQIENPLDLQGLTSLLIPNEDRIKSLFS